MSLKLESYHMNLMYVAELTNVFPPGHYQPFAPFVIPKKRIKRFDELRGN